MNFSRALTTSLFCGMALAAPLQLHSALPDLIINADAVKPRIVMQSFLSTDCDVLEGCVSAGERKLLQFNTETWNIGDADLVMGNPTNNPLFHFSDCHGHFHFEEFAVYNLLDTSGNLLVSGQKSAFCLEDVYPWDPNANPNRVYKCSYQGIQKGWADVYARGLPCQWIDITGVPPGDYLLQLILNPAGLLPESNTNNNVAYVPVTIPADCTMPVNDNFSNAEVIPSSVPASVLSYNYCASKEPGEPPTVNNSGGASIWYQWTPSENLSVIMSTAGSDFDTLLAVYTGSSFGNLVVIAANDDIVFGVNRQSRVSFTATQGTTYMISVDGYDGRVGRVQLNINPPVNDMFADCQTLSGVSGSVVGYNVGASRELGEPAHNAILGTHSVWYCWTALTNETQVFDTIGSDFDTVLAVYTGNDVASLTPVVGDDNSGGNAWSRLSFDAVAGTTYHIAVDGFTSTNIATSAGNVLLRWSPLANPQISINRSAESLNLTVNGIPGTYAVEYSDDLLQWHNLTNFTMTGSSFECTDSIELSNVFYRAALLPSPGP